MNFSLEEECAILVGAVLGGRRGRRPGHNGSPGWVSSVLMFDKFSKYGSSAWGLSVLTFYGLLVFLIWSPSQVPRTTVGRGT